MDKYKVSDERFAEVVARFAQHGLAIHYADLGSLVNGYEERLAAAKKRRDDMTAENNSLLILMARIREAAGDPKGKLMQDELEEHIRKLAQKEGGA